MKRVFVFLVLAFSLLGLVLGIKSAIKKNKSVDEVSSNSGDLYVHELNIPIMEIDSLNPLLTKNQQVSNILKLVYEPLVEIGNNELISPVLAVQWAQKDELNWIIKLRKNVKWHNDSEFTSKDVVFTINTLLDENFDSIYRSNVLNILSVEPLDEYSVVVTLKEKDDFIMYKLTFPIIPEYYFKNGDVLNNDKNNMPIGTGAYKYTATNDLENYIQLDFFDNWWKDKKNVKLNTIYLMKYSTYGEAIKAYKSAKVDIIITSMANWTKKFGTIGNNIYRFESSIFDVLIPNTKKGVLSESSVRKAILLSINRENIVQKVFDSNATIADMPIHVKSKNYFTNLQSDYDLDKAKQVLNNAGWVNNGKSWQKNKQILKVTILVNEENYEQVKVADIIKENLNEINIEVIIKKVSYEKLKSDLIKDSFDLAFTSLDIKNELSFLDIINSNNIYNYANYSNENIDNLINEIYTNYDENVMQSLERIWKDEVPYIGLYFRDDILLTNKSVKGSIEPTWSNPYFNIVSWCK